MTRITRIAAAALAALTLVAAPAHARPHVPERVQTAPLVVHKTANARTYFTPGIDGLAGDTAKYLASINLPTDPWDLTVATAWDRSADAAALATAGHVQVSPRFARDLREAVANRDAGRTSGLFVPWMVLHEAAHEVQWTAHAKVAEGPADALTADLFEHYIARVWGPRTLTLARTFRWSRDGVAYPVEVRATRAESAAATAHPWRSPEAFAYRVSLVLTPAP